MRTIGLGLSIVLLGLLLMGSAQTQTPAPGAGIYVADTGNNRIVRIEDMTGAGWTTLGGPAVGGRTNQFNSPRGVSVDMAGRIYVADTENNRIVRVDDMTGAGWTALVEPPGGQGECIRVGMTPTVVCTNQFVGLRSISVDAAGRIYVAEYLILYGTGRPIHRIRRINDMTGAGWVDFEPPFTEEVKSISGPYSVFVGATGRIYVADFTGNRIVRMNDMTGAEWIVVGSQVSGSNMGTPGGSGVKQFRGPNGIVVDTAGRIYVADSGNNRIVRMNDMTGGGWTALGTPGNGSNQFILPNGVAVDGAGRIYVVDFGNNRIVRMNDMTGAGWTTFGSSGNGSGQFNSPRGIFVR